IVSNEGPLPFHAAAGYVALAADALAHAHEQGIEHHGVRPDRLRLDQKGELKFLDIGVAGLVDPNQESSIQYKDPFEVDYLSPEQATGKNKVDYRADIYSLGCTLFFLVTGRPPYSGGTIEKRLRARIRKQPRRITKFQPNAPKGIVDICARMMATQPRERITTASEVRQLLQNWLQANPEEIPAEISGINLQGPRAGMT
ncbi:MAG: protein kinase, partial [Planctomycetales bacterium]